MSDALYKKHRPKTLKAVVGQEAMVSSLQSLMDKGLPHALLLTGPSGCGKTTVARILKTFVECGDSDFVEVNGADFRGIDTVREIRRYAGMAPMEGRARMWLIDECHKLSNDAQNALLKLLEDNPKRCYFILCTTDPLKVIRTIHTRSTEIRMAALNEPSLIKVLLRVVDKEQLKIAQEVLEEIARVVDGSARKALVILEQVAGLKTDEEQMAAIKGTTFDRDVAIEIARAFFNPRAGWGDVAPLLQKVKEQDPEGIRYVVLGYARAVLVGGEGKRPNPQLAPRAFKVIDAFSRNFWDSKAAGLAAACWRVLSE